MQFFGGIISPMDALINCDVTIVGLGLMGGSLALALAGKVRSIRGVEPSPEAARLALDMGLVGSVIPLGEAVQSDLIVLAAPARAILTCLDQLSALNPTRSVVVLDLGSTKREICAAMQSLPAAYDPIGGHPMCGKEVSGAANAEAGLFTAKTFILSPLERSSPRACSMAGQLVETVGAYPVELEPALHDRLVAHSSHLPYLSAVGLVQAADNMQDDRLWQVAASGFRDSTRLAGSDLVMMVDILLSNQSAVLEALNDYRTALDELERLVRAGDAESLKAGLASARSCRQKLASL